MIASRVRILLLAAIPLLAAVAVWTQIRSAHPAAKQRGDGITVVQAPAAPMISAAPLSAVGPSIAPIAAMDTLTRPEREAMFKSRSRDAGWASQTERRLEHALAGKLAGLSLNAVTCADVLCEVEGTIDIRDIGNQQTMIDALKDGAELGGAYVESGVARSGSITIDADDAGNLHFTQYLQRH